MKNIKSFILVETKPIPVYESDTGFKYTKLKEILLALFGECHISKWLDTLSCAYGITPISFKYHKKDKEKEYLIKIDDLCVFEKLQPNNPLLKEMKAINNIKYTKPNLMLVQDFCNYLNENYGTTWKRNKMFSFLRDNGFLEKVDTENKPTQKSIDLDLFQVVSNILEYQQCGEYKYVNFNTPYITEIGKDYLTKFILESGGEYVI